jgi:hypothetical protein
MPSVFEKSLTRSANKRTWQRIAGMAEAREVGCLKSGADSQPSGGEDGFEIFRASTSFCRSVALLRLTTLLGLLAEKRVADKAMSARFSRA